MNICKIDQAWQVNGTPIYTPSKDTKIQYDSLASSESGRTEDGVMHIGWVRRKIAKINLVYPAMTKAEALHLLNILQGKEFNFTYPDPVFGARTISAYASNSSYDFHTDAVYGGILTNVSINVIEK